MRSPILAVRVASLALVFGALFAVYFACVRPWARSWGATSAEASATLPGDSIVPDATSTETRAVTIAAPADRVFAWVAQTGQDRGGFYSYRILEDAVGCEMPSVEHLDPALQRWAVGDRLWMYPARKFDGNGSAWLRVYEPGRALAFSSHQIGTPPSAPEDGSWAMIVEPIDANSSRLLMRGRGRDQASFAARAFELLAFEPAHFVMEKKMMLSIRKLAEGGRLTPVADDVLVATWTATFLIMAVAKLRVLRGRGTPRAIASFGAAGGLFMFLTFVQPHAAIAVVLAILLAVAAFADLPRAWGFGRLGRFGRVLRHASASTMRA